jgi:hypothetical protein
MPVDWLQEYMKCGDFETSNANGSATKIRGSATKFPSHNHHYRITLSDQALKVVRTFDNANREFFALKSGQLVAGQEQLLRNCKEERDDIDQDGVSAAKKESEEGKSGTWKVFGRMLGMFSTGNAGKDGTNDGTNAGKERENNNEKNNNGEITLWSLTTERDRQGRMQLNLTREGRPDYDVSFLNEAFSD